MPWNDLSNGNVHVCFPPLLDDVKKNNAGVGAKWTCDIDNRLWQIVNLSEDSVGWGEIVTEFTPGHTKESAQQIANGTHWDQPGGNPADRPEEHVAPSN